VVLKHLAEAFTSTEGETLSVELDLCIVADSLKGLVKMMPVEGIVLGARERRIVRGHAVSLPG